MRQAGIFFTYCKAVVEFIMIAQKLLEGEKYAMVSLLVLYIIDLRDGVNHALDDLKLPAPADDPEEIAAKRTAILCVEVLVEDFDNRLAGR